MMSDKWPSVQDFKDSQQALNYCYWGSQFAEDIANKTKWWIGVDDLRRPGIDRNRLR